LVDGPRAWGSFDAIVGRYGVRRYYLTIYPPGIRTADRRLARLWRRWPIGGAALVLFAVMLFGDVAAPPDKVLAFGMAAYLSVGALLFLRAGPARVRVRSMSIILMPEAADVREVYKYAEWRSLVRMLIRADRRLATGAISLVEHEAACWAAYDRLGGISHV
jgi:hypothetical protein